MNETIINRLSEIRFIDYWFLYLNYWFLDTPRTSRFWDTIFINYCDLYRCLCTIMFNDLKAEYNGIFRTIGPIIPVKRWIRLFWMIIKTAEILPAQWSSAGMNYQLWCYDDQLVKLMPSSRSTRLTLSRASRQACSCFSALHVFATSCCWICIRVALKNTQNSVKIKHLYSVK